MRTSKGKPSNRRMRGISGFTVRQVQRYEALVQIALNALMRMPPGSDPEAMHDLRVSLRSQRVLLALFPRCAKVSEVRQRLGTAAVLTGQVRDLEAALARAESYLNETETGQEVVEAWRNEFVERQEALLDHLHSAHLDDTLEDAESAWSATILPKRRKALQARTRKKACRLGRKLLLQAAEVDQEPSLERWLQVRLTGERLRYWVEEFAELLTRRQRRRLKLLRCLQQALCMLHDLDMFEERFNSAVPMPEEWYKLLALEQDKARHEASSMLAELRIYW